MEWFETLLFKDSVAHNALVFSLTIAVGVLLGRIKIFGISLGVTWVLFSGIFFSHCGLLVNKEVEHFVKEFGLILFVYTVGLQVGPGFFSSLKKEGLTFNLLALSIVLLGGLVTLGLHFLTGQPLHVLTGIMSGAVTNTPGLGAAQQAIRDVHEAAAPEMINKLNLGYAVAYPFGVIGLILVLIFIQKVTRVNLKKEYEDYNQKVADHAEALTTLHVKLENPNFFNKPLSTLFKLLNLQFVVSRLKQGDEVITPNITTILHEGDVLMIVASKVDLPRLSLIGTQVNEDLKQVKSNMVAERIVVTQKEATHKPIKELVLKEKGYYNITRINRAGIEFIATGSSTLQMGDVLTVVGDAASISKFGKLLGNSLKRLDHPMLAPIFFGILLGIIVGSIPFAISGMPAPIKIGLAGGPLIIALILSRFGARFHIATYVTHSANLMLREIGIVLFLASVGLSSGEHFVEILSEGDGLAWMGYGVIITAVPLLIVGLISRFIFKKSFFEISGLLSGASTDPPALAFASHTARCDAPAVTYATVYPLTMILRILVAQLLIVLF
ncbi:putative transporter [Solitalea longa]|uniref:Putative transporter n=1 Tax=Solitalea longa TaxID=2079460 RepID=A0A2S5A2H9_9SPHI|nr:putative transporter [Solitalea longa]POY36313.1 putative transporter [Solitalea longa]